VDVDAVHDVARGFEATAALLDATRSHFSSLGFGGATAGKAYSAYGDSLRTALSWLGSGVSQWSKASAAVAVELRRGADRYRDADHRNAARVG